MSPVIAFYAYKGGTGRTLALVHCAWQLAREGRRVLLIDLDLGAPSLWHLLKREQPAEGFVELAAEWLAGGVPSIESYVHEVPLDPRAEGALFLLGAGRMDGSYLEHLQTFEWQRLLEPRRIPSSNEQQSLLQPERDFFTELREQVASTIDVDAIFIDAPTGFSDTANVCLRVVADVVTVIFNPTRIQLEGVGRVVSLLTTQHATRRRPDVYCVASTLMTRRVGGPQLQRIHEAFRFLDAVRYQALGSPELTDEENAAHVEQPPAVIAYESVVADLDAIDTTIEPLEVQMAVYEDPLSFLRQCVPPRGRPPQARTPINLQKKAVLDDLEPRFRQFAEAEKELDIYFLRRPHLEALHQRGIVVVLGGKGSGKTALFTYATRKIASPSVDHKAVHGATVRSITPDHLVEIGNQTGSLDTFWRLYALVQSGHSPVTGLTGSVADAASKLSALLAGNGDVNAVIAALKVPTLPVEIHDVWTRIDSDLGTSGKRLVLYLDGLDTAFKADLEERRRGLAALFVGWQATFSRLTNVETKVFLRSDLWDQLSFPEKSHLRLRTLRLNWEPESLWRLVLKRALGADAFSRLCKELGIEPTVTLDSVEASSIGAINPYLDVLFEQRIWAGKNSLSRNWIMRRLKDAKGTIFPRDILCLLSEAIKQEGTRLADGVRIAAESVLSRESLARALPPTSAQRVDALREEYPELVDVLQSLQGLSAKGELEALQQHLASLNLPSGLHAVDALEKAGVLSIEDSMYVVPALYLHGLNMPRPGPT